ncbi:serine/threonine protein kinase [Minicystis rosea]|nr:serine/threonine protein kinase [Minicystis rosea]
MSANSEDPASLRSYRLIAEIGRGGMANVYLAVARGPAGFNKLVVIKKTRKDLVTEGDSVAMFLDEARLAARMNHPNVVQTYEIGQDGERYFIAMEYLDGQPYSRVLSRLRARMPVALHLRVVADLLAGLHHAHELRDFDGTPLGVVHRDATPQNVFITYDGSIKVVDFGIAKAVDASAQTRTGVVKGKVAYMAPEQVRGDRLDRRTDVFAAGVMLFEAIAGRRMWDELPDVTVVHELMYDRVPDITAAVAGVPVQLARICQRALAANRDERYETALDMHRDLETYLAQAGQRASARDVGDFIAPAFEAERQRVRAVIESQLSDIRWTGVQMRATVQDLPSIDGGAAQAGPMSGRVSSILPNAPSFGAGGESGELVPSSSSLSPVSSASGHVIRPEQAVTSPSTRVPIAVAPPSPISFAPTTGGAAVPVPTSVMPAPLRRSLLVPALVAGLVSVAVLAAGVKLLVRPGGTAPAASATAPAEPKDVTPDAVTLTVRAKPAEARIYLDGVLLSAGPFEGKVLRSSKTRLVRVEAEGHTPKQEEIALTSDVVLSFDLQRDESAAPAPTVRATKPVSPSAGSGPGAAATSTGRGPKPRHDIDSDSPYKK